MKRHLCHVRSSTKRRSLIGDRIHGIANPDVITIALSTNDIGELGITSVDSLANCRLALEIKINQIKMALPNCKIGVVLIGIDAPTQSAIFKKFVAYWIDKCMKYVYGLNDTKVAIIPTWVHMCRNGIFPVGGVSSLVVDSDMKQVGIADGTHWGDLGNMNIRMLCALGYTVKFNFKWRV